MKKLLKRIALGIAVTLACFALYKMGAQVAGVLREVNWAIISLAVVGLALYQWLNASTWSQVFAGLGKDVPAVATARIWIESESMKWLPGGIWGYGSRVVNARKLGVEMPIASAALATELSLTVIAWSATALWILPTATGQELTGKVLAWVGNSGLLPCVAAFIASCVLLAVPQVRELIGKILARFIPSARDLKWQPRALIRAFASYFTLCLVNGSLFWLVTLAVPGHSVK